MIRFVNHKNFNHRTAIGEFPEFAWTDYEETFYKAYCSHLIAHPDLKESPEQFEAYLKEKCVSAKKIDPDMFDVGLPETVCGVAAIRRDYKEYNNSILKLLIESLSDLIYSFRA